MMFIIRYKVLEDKHICIIFNPYLLILDETILSYAFIE